MRYDITNIPVGEVFEEKCGCPLCNLRDKLENRSVEYITGAAMMEPDIRQQTNEQGFCITHYRQMLQKRNRLGVALIIESHLAQKRKDAFSSSLFKGKGKPEKTCFVCQQVDNAMEKMLATVCRTWAEQGDFRKLTEEQPYLCLPHYEALQQTAEKVLSKKDRGYFREITRALAENYMDELQKDVRHFCDMYDYRNAGNNDDWGNAKDAIERSVLFLTERKP